MNNINSTTKFVDKYVFGKPVLQLAPRVSNKRHGRRATRARRHGDVLVGTWF